MSVLSLSLFLGSAVMGRRVTAGSRISPREKFSPSPFLSFSGIFIVSLRLSFVRRTTCVTCSRRVLGSRTRMDVSSVSSATVSHFLGRSCRFDRRVPGDGERFSQPSSPPPGRVRDVNKRLRACVRACVSSKENLSSSFFFPGCTLASLFYFPFI